MEEQNDEQNNRGEKFATKSVKHISVKGPVNPVNVPIYSSSTYKLESAKHGAKLSSLEDPEDLSPWLYSRWGNPTTDVAGKQITNLEGGFGTHTTSSGMSAVTSALFSFLQKGDHVIAPEPVYGGTHEVFSSVLPNYGIEVSWVDGTDPEAFKSAIQQNTKVIYTESPANPTMSITDLEKVAGIAEDNDIVSMVDSTFASSYNQKPIDLGIDIVIHSATKYLGGHSDITAGSITSATEEIHDKIFQTLKLFGGTLSPFDGFLLSRGIKTLDVRMERHNKNAMRVAEYLQDHDKVDTVFYPGLASHPQHNVASKQMQNGFGGMLAFEVDGGIEEGKKVIENLNVIVLAVSLGGVESLVEHAATMTHTMVPREERLKGGITDGLIRLSVGIEDADDLIKDLDQALELI